MTDIIAHRGSKGTHPENTCIAFREAVRVGAEGMTQESIDGRSNTFQSNDFDEYMDVIDALFPKETSKRGRGVFY